MFATLERRFRSASKDGFRATCHDDVMTHLGWGGAFVGFCVFFVNRSRHVSSAIAELYTRLIRNTMGVSGGFARFSFQIVARLVIFVLSSAYDMILCNMIFLEFGKKIYPQFDNDQIV